MSVVRLSMPPTTSRVVSSLRVESVFLYPPRYLDEEHPRSEWAALIKLYSTSVGLGEQHELLHIRDIQSPEQHDKENMGIEP